MRYSVTGATGFVGEAVARLLRQDGHQVVALVRDPARAGRLTDLGVDLVRGDLDDAAAMEELCTDTDGLFHVAGWYRLGSRDPEQGWRTNVQGTRQVLAAVREAKVPRVVYTSTLAVNSDTGGRTVDESYRFTGRHLSVYDETKARAHQVAEQEAADGLPVVTVMPGLVYGPGDTSQAGAMIAAVIAGRRPLIHDGGRVCWAHVDDVARGHLLAMQHGTTGEAYMLAGEQASLADGLRRLAHLAGTRGPIVLPAQGVRAGAALAGVVGRVVPMPPLYAAESMRASLATYLGTPAKTERALGWSSRPLDDGLAELARG
ncbi:MAG: NAD-dependent epimerase/dehydratase family protein [Nocardioidaceae bacterium]